MSGSLYHSPLGLFDFQVDGAARTYWQWTEGELPVILSLWDTGIGKQQPLSEVVLTPGGWVPIGSIRPGDRVIGSGGSPVRVSAIHPQKTTDVSRVWLSDGTSVRCGGSHLWTVTSWTTRRIGGTQRRARKTETLETREIEARLHSQGRPRFSLPEVVEVKYPAAPDPTTDPYTMGVVLAVGWRSPHGVQIRASTDVLDLTTVPAADRTSARRGVETLSSPTLTDALSGLDLSRVPPLYLRGSAETRAEILAGILDSLGTPRSGGRTDLQPPTHLVEDLHDLVTGLGGTCTITSDSVSVRMPTQPHRSPATAAKWHPAATFAGRRAITAITRDADEASVCLTVDAPDGIYLTRWHAATHNSHLAMASTAMLIEDGLVDHILVIAETNKVLDWVEDDYPTYTDLTVGRYAGTLKKREKMLSGLPQVTVMSWETARNDICAFKPKSSAVEGPKMLTEALRGKRVAIVFDEFSRLRNRQSKTYLAWDYLINRVLRRSGPQPMILGLTATTVEKSPEDHWNAGRLIAPGLAGSVADFTANYVGSYDHYDNPATWKNLTSGESIPGVTPLNAMFSGITIRKRKTDPDVIDHFPQRIENPPTMVEMDGVHREIYNYVEEVFSDPELDDNTSRQGFGLLRQLAGHPMALVRSKGQHATEIVATLGERVLAEIKSAKIAAMLDWQARMGEQQTIIFTFYGQSILPSIQHSLETSGFRVSANHGGVSPEARKREQDAFKAGDTQIFLSSDAGAKGLNLGVGSGLLHYENPLLYSTFVQRSDRIHRIDSRHASVTIDQLVVRNSIEVPITALMLKRNQWAEKVQDTDYTEHSEPTEKFLRAADRLAMLRRAT